MHIAHIQERCIPFLGKGEQMLFWRWKDEEEKDKRQGDRMLGEKLKEQKWEHFWTKLMEKTNYGEDNQDREGRVLKEALVTGHVNIPAGTHTQTWSTAGPNTGTFS